MRERERKEREAQGGAVSVSSGGGGGGRASPPNPRNATVIKPFDGTFEWDKVSTMVAEKETDPANYMPPAAQFTSFDSWRAGHDEIQFFGGRGGISVRPWTGRRRPLTPERRGA